LVLITSNLGSELWMDGKADSVPRDTITHAIQEYIRPEFLTHIDEIVIFHSLSRAVLILAVDILLQNVFGTLAELGYGWSSVQRNALSWSRVVTMPITVLPPQTGYPARAAGPTGG
jgi:ATP-dependent Clp protease ATP-binding subunit ClpA